MNEKVRYGVIGCGTHALRGHILPAKNVPELELVSVFDPDPFAMQNIVAATDGDIHCLASEDDLLADPEIDAVMVCSPDKFHMSSIVKAIEAGKHVLCDKPLATTQHECVQLMSALSAAAGRGFVVTSCHPRRFNPPYVWLKENLGGMVRQFGKVLHCTLDFSYHKPSKQGLHTGLLADHFNHEIDYLRFLLGDASFSAKKVVDQQDYYQATGLYGGEVAFTFIGTRRLESRVYPEHIRLRFERGEIAVNTFTGVAKILSHETSEVEQRSAGSMNYKKAFAGVMRNFARSILDPKNTALYLSSDDLLCNAESCVMLTETGVYEYGKTL